MSSSSSDCSSEEEEQKNVELGIIESSSRRRSSSCRPAPRKKSSSKKGKGTGGGPTYDDEGTLISISVLTPHYLKFFLDAVRSSSVVVYFTGSWCGPARMINDDVVQLSEQYLSLTFIKMDLSPENNKNQMFEFMMCLEIRALPTFLFYHKGELVYKLVGVFVDELRRQTEILCQLQVNSFVDTCNAS